MSYLLPFIKGKERKKRKEIKNNKEKKNSIRKEKKENYMNRNIIALYDHEDFYT